MSRSKNNNEFSNMFFKPVVIKTDVEEKFGIIYSYNSVSEHNLDDEGNVIKTHKDIVKFLDIARTMALGSAVVDSVIVDNRRKFVTSLTEVPISQCFQDIINSTSVVLEEVTELNERLNEMRNVLSAIKKSASVLRATNASQGNIVLAGTNEPLAHIVFKTISGDKIDITKNLSSDDITNLGGVLIEIIRGHINDDIDNPTEDFLKKLRAEVEYRIVESLPVGLKAGDIHINIEAFVDEIKRFREDHNEESE